MSYYRPQTLHSADRNAAILEKPDESLSRSIVARYARGNVRLQLGRYITREQIDARYEKLKDVEF